MVEPYKDHLEHHEPVSEGEMKITKFAGNNTICQTLRDAYALIDSCHYNDAKLKLRLAVAMGKAMDNKLQEYKKDAIRRERRR